MGAVRVFRDLGRGAKPNTEPFLERPWVSSTLVGWRTEEQTGQLSGGQPGSVSMPDRDLEEDA